VDPILLAIGWVLFIFMLVLVARVVVELVRAFARDWRPAGGLAVVLETIYTVTDPPVRLLRKLIPTVRVGGVVLDLSVTVLLLAVWIALQVTW
jgi:YggT family protein